MLILLTMFVLGARPSKRKAGDIESLQQKKAKAKSTVPPGMQMIDLAHDALASSNTLRSTTSTPVTTTFDPPSPFAISATIPHQELSTLTALSVSTTHIPRSPSHSPQVATPAIPAQLLAHSNAICSAAAVLTSNVLASNPGASTISLLCKDKRLMLAA